MSQNDLTIANQGFASFRSDLNSALQALGSTNSGTSAPSTTFANQLFYDTANNILKIRNEDNDAFISLFTLDQTNDNIESLTVNGNILADNVYGASDANTGIQFEGSDVLTIHTGGAENVKFGTGATVFNEDSGNIDFRIESNNQANMFVVDGGEDIVSIIGGASYTVGSFKNALQIEGTTGQTSSMSIARNTAGTSPPYLQFGKSRGASVGSNTIVQSGDDLGIITWSGADGTNRDTNGAMIRVAVDGTPGENDMPSRMMFSTTADGASSTSERMRIHNGGVVSIGNGIALGVGTANTASNVLDDYEEGTFDVTVSDATSGGNTGSVTQTNKYTKIGNLVVLQIALINITTTGLSANVPLYFQGSPFTPMTGSFGSGAITANLINVESNCYNHNVFINAGTTYLELNQSLDNSGSGTTHVTAINNGNADVFATVVFNVA